MQRFNQWLAGPRVLLLAVAAWVLFLPSIPAHATPVNLFLDGTSGLGFDASSVSAFQSAGGQTLGSSPTIFDNSTGPYFTVTPPGPVNITLASNSFTKTNPFVWSSTWTIQATQGSYNNLWVVFWSHDPTDLYPYTTSDIGLQVDPQAATSHPWRLIQPDPQQSPNTYYLAIFLGDLNQGASMNFGLKYVVGESLFSVPGSSPTQYVLPKLRVGFTEAALPEPGSLVLLAAGVLGAALAARRRSC